MSPKVSESYREEKRAVILAGALECFIEKGFQATTVDDIARHLGISKGALYGYFSSKEDIFIQMANARMDAMMEALDNHFKDMATAKEKIRYVFSRFKNQDLADLRKWLTFHLEFMVYASRHPHLIELNNKYMNKALGLLQQLIADGKRTGEFREELDETSGAYLFWAVRDGLALHFLLDGRSDDYRRILNDMEDMVLRFLLRSPRLE